SAELGAIRIVSLPRSSRTRPLLPVRIESPGLSCAWSVSEAGCTPALTTHTLPDDLLTCQTGASWAAFWDWAEAPLHSDASAVRQNMIGDSLTRNNMEPNMEPVTLGQGDCRQFATAHVAQKVFK